MHDKKNHQAVLAEQFVLMSTLTNQASYETVLTIRRWKLMKKVQGLGKGYSCDLTGNANCTFPYAISWKTILDNEGYFITNLLN